MRAAARPSGIAHLEDPRLTDRLQHVEELLHGWLTSRGVTGMAMSWSARLRGLIAGAILVGFRWWAPIVLWVGYRAMRHYSLGTGFLFLRRWTTNTQQLRRANYILGLVHSGTAAKETRIYGLSGWLIKRYETWWQEGMRTVWRERVRHELKLLVIVVLYAGATSLVAARIGLAGVSGEVSVAAAVVFLQALSGMSGFAATGDAEWQMHFGAYRARQARRLGEAALTPDSDLRGTVLPAPLSGEIRFEGVTFAYPGQDASVLEGVDLTIPAGRSIAIVGRNGAGKTTLIKLLCRLYDPSGGRITVDGVDLSTIDAAAWRRQVGVIFQDYIRYELTARENIGFGARDLVTDDGAVRRAADLAGATSFLDRCGWDVPLSRRYDHGVDVSGGEWQRIALARALLAVEGGARVLILDEPTANLDTRAEAAIYDRFLEITRGVTSIIISHRFSTVRMADHIVVIEGGRVVEHGSHADLLALDGRYAEMFNAQASTYFDDEAPVDA
jgi:ATP-binding cassette subfamily B protein